LLSQSSRRGILDFSLRRHGEHPHLTIREIWCGIERFPAHVSRFPPRVTAFHYPRSEVRINNLQCQVCIAILTATGARDPLPNSHPHHRWCTIWSPCLLLAANQASQARPPCPTVLLSIDRRLVGECFLLRLGASTLRKISLEIPKQSILSV
jgi:hypothetical protein